MTVTPLNRSTHDSASDLYWAHHALTAPHPLMAQETTVYSPEEWMNIVRANPVIAQDARVQNQFWDADAPNAPTAEQPHAHGVFVYGLTVDTGRVIPAWVRKCTEDKARSLLKVRAELEQDNMGRTLPKDFLIGQPFAGVTDVNLTEIAAGDNLFRRDRVLTHLMATMDCCEIVHDVKKCLNAAGRNKPKMVKRAFGVLRLDPTHDPTLIPLVHSDWEGPSCM